MKRYLFLMTTALVATFAVAQTRDSHGIITEQPDGELRAYLRSGGATYANMYFRNSETQDGIASEVVFSEDGTKAYFKNIISHAATATWVEGAVDGHTITIPLGQKVYWFDDGNYGMMLARVKVNGGIEKYTVDYKGTVTYAIEGDNLVLQDTSGDPANNVFDGLGFVYTDAYVGEWSYYLDYATVMTYKDVHPITPPEELETERYSMEYEGSGHLVNVGFDGDEVYIQGVSETRLPEAWMKGTIKGKKITFPLAYAGFYSSYLLYFCGADAEYGLDSNGYYNWLYYWKDGSTTCDYDAATGSFSTQQTIFASNSDSGIGLGETYHSPRFRPYTEQAGTPVTPNVAYYQEMGAFTILMLNVPLLDTEGRFLDPAKVSYRLFVDDDEEPFTFYTDEYKQLPQDMEEIPYLFTDETREAFSRSYIYEKAYALYLFQTGFDRIGVQTIYRGGGEEHTSAIGYYDITGAQVATPTIRRAQDEHFDLQGRRVANGHKGLTITRTPDGRVVKHLNR